MKRPSKLSFVLLAAGIVAGPNSLGGQDLESTVRRLMADHSVPGLALVIVRGDSTELHGWGAATVDESQRVTPDTPFRIASVAKVLVAATVLRESGARGIDLHSDVEPLIGFPLTGAFSGPVTLHHLLTHTGGFDERMVGYAARSSQEMRELGEYLGDRMPERGWPAGETVSYSNHGMSLAAFAVERAAGRSFADVAGASLFGPLGMTSTAFLKPGMSMPPSAAQALSCDEGGCEARPHLFSHTYPAGLAFSTARDMGRFITAGLMARGADEGLSDLFPQRFSHDARIPGMSYGFFNQTHSGRPVLAHSGSAGGYWALLLIAPEEEVGFFFAANGGSPDFGAALRDELLGELFEGERGQVRTPRRSEDPAVRAGPYELTRYSHRTIERLPQLFHNSIRLEASGDTLVVFAGGTGEKFLQVEDSLYQRVGSSELLAFGTRQEEPYLFRSSDVYGALLPAAYERRHRLHGSNFLNEYISWLLAAPLMVMVLLWPMLAGGGAYLRKRRGQDAPPVNLTQRAVTLLTALAALLFAWFVLGFTAQSNRLLETGEMVFGMPDPLSRLLWIPYAHVALTALLVLVLPKLWSRRWWTLARRVVFSVMVGALILQAVFLFNWNYLPAVW